MDKKEYQAESENIYETGPTRPPERRGGRVAAFLCFFILLFGLAGVTGRWNFRLFQKVTQQNPEYTEVVLLTQADAENQEHLADTAATVPEGGANRLPGFAVRELSRVDRAVYRIPKGVCVTQVDAGSDAAAKGVLAGDVLLRVNDVTITDKMSLEEQLAKCPAGQRLKLTFLRGDKQYTVLVGWEKPKP